MNLFKYADSCWFNLIYIYRAAFGCRFGCSSSYQQSFSQVANAEKAVAILSLATLFKWVKCLAAAKSNWMALHAQCYLSQTCTSSLLGEG